MRALGGMCVAVGMQHVGAGRRDELIGKLLLESHEIGDHLGGGGVDGTIILTLRLLMSYIYIYIYIYIWSTHS